MRMAVIPARGGSKRIPGKNIRPFAGKPMLAWTLEAALASGCFDRIVVSTDDEAIARMAQDHGAEVPFLRAASLADDHTPTIPVIADAIRRSQSLGWMPEQVCCLYATAPFLQAGDIRAAMERLLADSNLDYVFAATAYRYPIQRSLMLDEAGHVAMLYPEHRLTRSQDLVPAYHDAGQFYWGRTSAWLADKAIFSERSSVVLLPGWRVQDIDDENDWKMAEYLHAVLQAQLTQ